MKTKNFIENLNLRTILLIGLFFRILAAIFSKGYAMMDDHFLVIEVAQSWVDGFDYNGWFTETYEQFKSGRSYVYPGFHYLLFSGLEFIGIENPDTKMYFVRFIHAIYSLLVVYYAYKITEKLSDKKTANLVGLMCATLFLFPAMSVKNLVEMVTIPFLMMGYWFILKSFDKKKVLVYSMIAGAAFAISFSLRYQIAFFVFGVVIGMIYKKKFKELIFMIIGGAIPFLLIHGLMEYKLSGVAFGKLRYYVEYNIFHSKTYFKHPWYNYFILVPGLLIPPLGAFLFVGSFYTWKKHTILFLGVMVFFAFHSYFPNKQERFMYTMIPFFIILGVIGWGYVTQKYKFWGKHKWIMKFSWRFFWIINIAVLFVFSTYYSKKSRVETMLYLNKKGDVNSIVIEDQFRGGTATLPEFYLGKWVEVYKITKSDKYENFKKQMEKLDNTAKPNYVVFADHSKGNIEKRVEQMETILPNLKYETTIGVSFIDWLNAKLNPVIETRNYIIYKVDCHN